MVSNGTTCLATQSYSIAPADSRRDDRIRIKIIPFEFLAGVIYIDKSDL